MGSAFAAGRRDHQIRRSAGRHRSGPGQPSISGGQKRIRLGWREIEKIVGFWLELELSGFRVDAVNFQIELDGIADPGDLDPHGFLRDLRAFLNRRRGDP